VARRAANAAAATARVPTAAVWAHVLELTLLQVRAAGRRCVKGFGGDRAACRGRALRGMARSRRGHAWAGSIG
jgi:hypothetical protein